MADNNQQWRLDPDYCDFAWSPDGSQSTAAADDGSGLGACLRMLAPDDTTASMTAGADHSAPPADPPPPIFPTTIEPATDGDPSTSTNPPTRSTSSTRARKQPYHPKRPATSQPQGKSKTVLVECPLCRVSVSRSQVVRHAYRQHARVCDVKPGDNKLQLIQRYIDTGGDDGDDKRSFRDVEDFKARVLDKLPSWSARRPAVGHYCHKPARGEQLWPWLLAFLQRAGLVQLRPSPGGSPPSPASSGIPVSNERASGAVSGATGDGSSSTTATTTSATDQMLSQPGSGCQHDDRP